MHEVAAEYFREQLAGPAGARARQQLAERGVSAKTVEQLGLGYAPASREGLKARLLKQGFAQGLLIQSGLVVARDNGEVVDRFRNRLMVPICRDTGSVIAFGGRSMDADQVPKYLNSPETPIYSKGRTLYGLNLTKAAIRKLGFVVLVEGYFDFAQVFQSEAAPVVASCGTALTPQQAQLLRRFTSKVVLSYDPDAAGQGAAARSCELLVTEGFEVNVVVLDNGEDPDTFIRRKGPDEYRARLRSSRPYLEYLRDRAAAGLDFGDPETQRTFLAEMLAVAAWLPEPAMRDQFADKVAHTARITAEVVQSEFRKIAAKRQTDALPGRATQPGRGEKGRKSADLVADSAPGRGAGRPGDARRGGLAGAGGAPDLRDGAEPARRDRRGPTIGPDPASKYSGCPAGDDHRIRTSPASDVSRRMCTGHEAAALRPGARRHSAGNRPASGTWRHSTRE